MNDFKNSMNKAHYVIVWSVFFISTGSLFFHKYLVSLPTHYFWFSFFMMLFASMMLVLGFIYDRKDVVHKSFTTWVSAIVFIVLVILKVIF